MTAVHTVKSKGKISQNFVAFSEYMNFNLMLFWCKKLNYFSSFFAATRKSKDEDYTCPGGSIIPNKYLCDGIKDCRDNSDEQNCPAGKSKLIIPNLSAC